MENSILNILPEGLSNLFNNLRHTTSKMQRTAGNIGFVFKCINQNLTPTFAKVEGSFKHERDRQTAVNKILRSELQEHRTKLKTLIASWNRTKQITIAHYGAGPFKLIRNLTQSFLTTERRSSLASRRNPEEDETLTLV